MTIDKTTMTMHRLFGFKGSGSAAVEMALAQAGVDFTRIEAASWDAGSDLAALDAVNPLRQIPTLQLPDGTTMSESAAILIQLGLDHAESGLLPTSTSERAQAIRGLVFIAANCYAAIGVNDYPERWIAEPDDAAIDRLRRGSRSRLHHYWSVFAEQFTTRPFLTGAAPGALDYLATVVSRWSGARAHLRDRHAALHELLQRVDASPHAAPVIARHWSGRG